MLLGIFRMFHGFCQKSVERLKSKESIQKRLEMAESCCINWNSGRGLYSARN